MSQDNQLIEKKEKNDDKEKNNDNKVSIKISKVCFTFKTIKNKIDFQNLELNDCHVNIFAMKQFIKNNFKSLKIIKLIMCSFYLSDKHAEKKENKQYQVTNQRMFQELKFDWLIEQFKFNEIQEITIELSNDPQKKQDNKKNKQIKVGQNTWHKYISSCRSLQEKEQEKEEKEKEEKEQEENLKREILCQLFDCEKDSKFVDYETQELEKFLSQYTELNLKKQVQQIIWGDIKNKEKSKENLYLNIIYDIQQNLSIFQKYTQHALKDNKLIIIGDVLYNGQSLKQLYNLIQLNCENIDSLIFKDNGKIPTKVFSNLMKQIFLIPKLKQISFLSSVLEEKSLIELQYLIKEKKVQYLILFRSYFLRHEFDKLLNIKSEQSFEINHQRFVIIDISCQKEYEFTPYSDLFDQKGKTEENMFLVEIIFQKQQEYDQKIKDQIKFFIGKNLSIINKNESEKILFKYWGFLNKTEENQKLEFKEKQDDLIKILESQFREDDINILNYSLIKTLIKNVIDNGTQQKFQDILKKSKSFQFLNEKFPIQVAEKISFEKESYLQACYSYVYGFTTIKLIGIYYIFNNSKLYHEIRENKKKSLLEVQGLEASYRMLNADIKDRKSLNKQLKQIVDFKKLVDLKIQGNLIPNLKFEFLNDIFRACVNLQKLSLSSNLLSDNKLKGVNFSYISNKLEEFDINHNTNIQDMSFLNDLFKKATELKKLGLKQVQLKPSKIKTINFKNLSFNCLKELDISFNQIRDLDFLDTIFQKNPDLKKIDMTKCSIYTDQLKNIKFAPGLKEIIMDDNLNLNLADLIVKIGETHKMQLEYFSAFNISVQGKTLGSEYDKYLGKLKAFSNLKKLHFRLNDFSDERHVNLILSNIQFGHTDLIMRYTGLNEIQFEKLLNNYFQNIQIIDLSGSHQFNNFKFLSKLFKKTTQLQSLNLSESRITNVKLCDEDIVDIPESLQEFYFSYNNEYQNINKLLNKILFKCKNLLILHLENCNLNEHEIKQIYWKKISTHLIDLNISNNPEIKTYEFLNDIFKEAEGLQKINLSYNQVGALNQIKFNHLYHRIIEFITDNDEFYNKEFQDYLIDKFKGQMNLWIFQQKYSQIEKNSIINYFDNFKKSENKIEDKKNSKEEDQQKEQNKEIQNSKDVKYPQHINPLFFDIFFPSFIIKNDQEKDSGEQKKQQEENNGNQIDIQKREQNNDSVKKQNQQLEIKIEQFIKYQNVYVIENITEIDLSNMDFQFDKIEKFNNKFPSLKNINFSGNKCNKENIFEFVDSIIQNAPILEKLNLSNMNIHKKNICKFELVSKTLLELNISENKDIQDLSVLNGLFKRCKKLNVLNISKTGLNQKKIKSTEFENISKELQVFNCSNNQLDAIDFINVIIKNCKKIVSLNLSNCKIDNELFDKLIYKELGSTLQEFNISKNEILLNVMDLNTLLKNCKSLKKIDIRGIVDLMDDRATDDQFKKNHSLEQFYISGNLENINHSFIQELIKNSNEFDKLIIQKESIFQKNYDYSIFQKIIKRDKYYNQENKKDKDQEPFHFEDITSITFLKAPLDFSKLLQLQESNDKERIFEILKNLIKLDLSGCHKSAFIYLEKIFSANIQLEELNLSGVKISQACFNSLNFKNTPNTLQVLDLSYNNQIVQFEFLNEIFQATANSLISLNLSYCDLKKEKLEKVDFYLLNYQIKEINLSNNENLDNINFLEELLKKASLQLNMLKLPRFSFEIIDFLQRQYLKIKEIDCNFQSIDFEFFSQEKFVTNINIIKFLKYIFQKNGKSSKQLLDSQDQKRLIIIEFLKQMMYKKSQKKTLKTIQHFFFLLFNELKIQSYTYQSQDFILSPYFLFQQHQDIQCEDDEEEKYEKEKKEKEKKQKEQKEKEKNENENNKKVNNQKVKNEKKEKREKKKREKEKREQEKKEKEEKEKNDFIINTYELAFFKLNMLKDRKTKYIFGYDKFFFLDLPDFYVQNHNSGLELQFIIDLKNKMKKNRIKQAFLPIRLELTQEIIKNKKMDDKNLDEYKVIKLLNCIPPAEISLKGLSIQFVKSWYAINFYSPLSVQTLIEVDYTLLENSSIADFLAIHSYDLYIQNFTGNSFSEKIKSGFGMLSYKFFNLLCSEPKKFAFDHTVIHLEKIIKKKLDKRRYNVLRVLFPTYIFVCIFGICFFSFGLQITCGHGVSWYSYITYGFFGFLTFVIEALIFSKCLKHVSHLIPELKPNCLQSFPYPLINSIKLFILEINWLNQWYINYFVSFVLSQISRLDFFTNIAFLFTTFQCGDMLVFTLGLISLSLTTLIWIIFFIINVKDDDTYHHLITGSIDKLYQICNLLEFQAVADILDIISPSNSIVIFGKMFNQRIINNIIRILFQDIPFLLIQVVYLLRKGIFNETIIFSIASSSVMFLVSLYHFLTITPSRLDQEDFNQMISIKKERKILPNYLQSLSQYELQILKFNQNEFFKCIRSEAYFNQTLENQSIKNSEYDKQLSLAKKLGSQQINQQFMDIFFSDKEKQKDEFEKKKIIINNEKRDNQQDAYIKQQIYYIKEYLNNHEIFYLKQQNQTKQQSQDKKNNYCLKIIKRMTGFENQSQKKLDSKIKPIDKDNQSSKSYLLTQTDFDKENKQSPVTSNNLNKNDGSNRTSYFKYGSMQKSEISILQKTDNKNEQKKILEYHDYQLSFLQLKNLNLNEDEDWNI